MRVKADKADNCREFLTYILQSMRDAEVCIPLVFALL